VNSRKPNLPNAFNQQVIDEFRANHGRVGGYFEGAWLLLLTTSGARTGTLHTFVYEAEAVVLVNTGSMAEALKVVHDAFRRELSLVRQEVTRQGATLGAQLRINCLTLCQGLHNHHTGEELGTFPLLADRHPEFAPALDRLRQEHERIAELLEELRRVVAAEDADPIRVLSDVERLTTELEAHPTYEEEQLFPLLAPAPAPAPAPAATSPGAPK